MNKQRRAELDKASQMIENAKGIIENCQAEEQDCFDNLTEGLQQTERGQLMEENVSRLQDCLDNLDSVLSDLEESQQ